MKLDPEPRLSGISATLMEWARKVALIVNSLVDSLAALANSIATIAGYFVSGVLGIANGGTGANTAAGARTNLGAVNKAGDTMTGSLGISVADGTAALVLSTSNMASHNNVIMGQDNGTTRWAMELGATSSGDFALTRIDGSSYLNTPFVINWGTGAILLNGGTTVNGQIYSETAARINGYTSKAGVAGGFGGNTHNWYWSGSSLQAWVDTTNVGTVTLTSDERVKRDIKPLVSNRAAFLAIKPISYHWRDVGIFKDDGEHWGFSAQNLLKCVPLAVNGRPDAALEDGTPQPMSVQDRPILAMTVLQVQQLIAATESQARLIAELRAKLDTLTGA